MLKLNTLLGACLMILSTSLFAQTNLDSGVIKMEITNVASEDENMAAGLEMLKGTETNYYFNKEKSLVKANMMGGMMEMTTLVNNEDEFLTFTMNMMGQKMLVESTKEERDAAQAKNNTTPDVSDFEITYDEEDTKEILGYTCFKANVSNEDGGFGFICYVTEDIKASSKMIQGLDQLDIRGFPLEYIMDAQQMQMTYTATEVSEEFDTEIFNIDTKGYKKMTFEEFMETMGSMGGGMGF